MLDIKTEEHTQNLNNQIEIIFHLQLILIYNMSQPKSDFSYDEINQKDQSDQFQLNVPDFNIQRQKNDDSIDNNIDAYSNKDDELNHFLGDQYENNNRALSYVNLVQNLNEQVNQNPSDFKSIFSSRSNLDQYQSALKDFLNNFQKLDPFLLADLMKSILSVPSSNILDGSYFIRSLIFMKQLSKKLRGVANITKYFGMLNEILEPSQPFYQNVFSEQTTQVLEIYLMQQPQQNEMEAEGDQDDIFGCTRAKKFSFNIEVIKSLQSAVEEFLTESSVIMERLYNFYNFIHQQYFEAAFRQQRKYFKTNILLISRNKNEQMRRNQLQTCYQACFFEDFAQLDKRELEQYSVLLQQLIPLETEFIQKYIFKLVQWLLIDSQMQRKILAFKILGELVGVTKSNPKFQKILITWLLSNDILDKFIRQSTHARILQQISPVLHFLYEQGITQSSYIVNLMKQSLHSEDIFKVVQGMLSWLRLEHLQEALDLLNQNNRDKQRDSISLYSQFISSLVGSLIQFGNNSKKRKNIVLQDNRKELEGEMDIEVEQPSEKFQHLAKRLFKLLVEKAGFDQQLFMPILLKHITSHMKLLKPQLEKEVISLLRQNSPCGVWILEQFLRIQTSQGNIQGKNELIGKLAGDGVYQLTLALVSRHRFSKAVVDKGLSVIILFCRFHKPLERSTTEYLWKVLGLTASEERQREQFFVFLKEIVRFEGAVSEDSVNFIFFDLMMKLTADWFSVRVYDCLQMLFLRLNQDCKLIIFDKDHYEVAQFPLVGADKIWYIYFNCPDLKVTKKIKDLIFKLIANSPQKKQELYREALINIKRYLEAALQLNQDHENKQQILILRGFQISEKLLFEKQRQDEINNNAQITLKVIDTTPNNFEKNKCFELSQKLTLAELKLYIAQSLNPTRKFEEIQLLNKGKVLVGQNQTLKEMKLSNNETVTVSLIDQVEKKNMKSAAQKEAEMKKQVVDLIALFGKGFSEEYLTFVVKKFQGEKPDIIAEILFEPDRAKQLIEQFNSLKEEAEDDFQINIQKLEHKKFGEMLVQTVENVQLFLNCLKTSHNKNGGWKFLKELPINQQYLKVVQQHIDSGDWEKLFYNRTNQQSKYITYIITRIMRQSSARMELIFDDKNLRTFLLEQIELAVGGQNKNLDDYEGLFKLLLMSLTCPLFSQLESFMVDKKSKENKETLVLKLSSVMDIQPINKISVNFQICQKLFDTLLLGQYSEKIAINIIKLYSYQLYFYYYEEKAYFLLNQEKLYLLLLKYGKPIYFAIIALIMRVNCCNNFFKDFNLSQFTLSLLNSALQLKENKQSKFHFQPFFCCLEQMLSLTVTQNRTEQLNYLSTILKFIQQNISNVVQDQIIGYMKISLNLLKRHFHGQHHDRRNDQLEQFADWLFNTYLFGLKTSFPYFKAKNVRKIAYRLIIELCQYPLINKHICQSIKKIMNNCKGLEKEQGQFRSQNLIGMRNLGATCYINSLLQQLYHTIFPKLIIEEDTIDKESEVKMLQLKKIFVNLYIGVKSPVNTKKYMETVKINGERVMPLVQQDTNQYFASLMHQIEQEVGEKPIKSVMSGTLCHEIRGLEEGSEVKNVEQTFLTLIIQMKGKKNLPEALSAMSKQHILEGDNMYYSQVLMKKIRASSKTYLDKLPPLLVITLKRFTWIFQHSIRTKINDYFQFPLELDLSKYSIPGKKEGQHYYQYRLCGILIHSGSAESGHYYSFIKVEQKWLEFNDNRVTQWDIQTNLKNDCFGGNQQRNRNAYMLFYERVESQVHGASLNLLSQNNKLINLVKKQNENFIKNKLIYDSGYIDFIRNMMSIQGNYSLGSILDTFKVQNSHSSNDLESLLNKIDKEDERPTQKQELTRKFHEVTNTLFSIGVEGERQIQTTLYGPSSLSPFHQSSDNNYL